MGIRDGVVTTCCLNCKERFPACHDVCTTYLKAKAEYEQEKERIREEKRKSRLFDDYHLERLSVARKIRSGKDRK